MTSAADGESSPILLLPDETWLAIFRTLHRPDTPSDLLPSTYVCRTFRRIAQEVLYDDIDIQNRAYSDGDYLTEKATCSQIVSQQMRLYRCLNNFPDNVKFVNRFALTISCNWPGQRFSFVHRLLSLFASLRVLDIDIRKTERSPISQDNNGYVSQIQYLIDAQKDRIERLDVSEILVRRSHHPLPTRTLDVQGFPKLRILRLHTVNLYLQKPEEMWARWLTPTLERLEITSHGGANWSGDAWIQESPDPDQIKGLIADKLVGYDCLKFGPLQAAWLLNCLEQRRLARPGDTTLREIHYYATYMGELHDGHHAMLKYRSPGMSELAYRKSDWIDLEHTVRLFQEYGVRFRFTWVEAIGPTLSMPLLVHREWSPQS